jgi:hypothetical protein
VIRKLLVLIALPLSVFLCAPPVAAVPESSVTVVSFTFDGSYKSQDLFAEILSAHGLAGTFYVNSGYLDYPAYLSVDQLRTIARDRSEIGGASLYGNDLSTLSESQVSDQVCNDRTTLAQLGFQVTSFAYPHGTSTPAVKAAVQRCGYNSGRRYTGLYDAPDACSSCPAAETLPATDDFRIRTPSQATSLPALQGIVTRAGKAGGGWVPLVFTKVCVCPDDHGAIDPSVFSAFVDWLTTRPDVQVKTVDQVMGGTLKPVHGAPLDRLVPDPSSAISHKEPLSRASAWSILGFGIGQAQIIFTGVAVSIAMVVTYRLATRGNRHAA